MEWDSKISLALPPTLYIKDTLNEAYFLLASPTLLAGNS